MCSLLTPNQPKVLTTIYLDIIPFIGEKEKWVMKIHGKGCNQETQCPTSRRSINPNEWHKINKIQGSYKYMELLNTQDDTVCFHIIEEEKHNPIRLET